MSRWWDGCTRTVESRVTFKPPGTGHSSWLETLSCGHRQKANGGGVFLPGQTLRVCLECVRNRYGSEVA